MSPATNGLGTSVLVGGSCKAPSKHSGTAKALAASLLGGVVKKSFVDSGRAASLVGGGRALTTSASDGGAGVAIACATCNA